MRRLIFDIETDGLLDCLSKIHCLEIKDMATQECFSCKDPAVAGDAPYSIAEGLALLAEADEIVGHNIIGFDIPALQKIYPWFQPQGRLRDSLIMARLLWPEIKSYDFVLARKNPAFPKKLIGSQGLEAWGWRLGLHKGDYAAKREQELLQYHAQQGWKRPSRDQLVSYVWAQWNQDMQDYCKVDVQVTEALLKRIDEKNYAPDALEMEHRFAGIIRQQEEFGFPFDEAGASRLYAEFCDRRQALVEALQQAFPPWEMRTAFVPQVNNKNLGYFKGVTVYKSRQVTFNPGSRDHIARCFKDKYGWEPDAFTDGGKPKLDEEVLSRLPYPEAALLNEYLLVQKRAGQVAEGKNGWLKKVRGGRIHGRMQTVGAITRRCTHQEPNISQVPGVQIGKDKNPLLGLAGGYGYECRSLFRALPGMVQVGADASGLELRCLAHYMARYDDGLYAREVVEGDVHSMNQAAAGLATRAQAKTFIYAFLYGAGGYKIGTIVGVDPAEVDAMLAAAGPSALAKARRELDYLGMKAAPIDMATCLKGHALKARFLKQTPALARLQKAVKEKAKQQKQLLAIDGGVLTVRSAHSALNTLLQSAGSIAVKKATVLLYDELSTRGWIWGKDWAQVAHIHDEIQTIVRPELAEELGNAAIESIRRAGALLGFRCNLDGEFKIGRNWAETH